MTFSFIVGVVVGVLFGGTVGLAVASLCAAARDMDDARPEDDRADTAALGALRVGGVTDGRSYAGRPAAPQEDVPKYRVLQRGEVIQADDEFLSDDGAMWLGDSAGVFIGMPHASGVLKGARRRIDAAPAPPNGEANMHDLAPAINLRCEKAVCDTFLAAVGSCFARGSNGPVVVGKPKVDRESYHAKPDQQCPRDQFRFFYVTPRAPSFESRCYSNCRRLLALASKTEGA